MFNTRIISHVHNYCVSFSFLLKYLDFGLSLYHISVLFFLSVVLLYSVSVCPLSNVQMLSNLGTKHTQILETAAAKCQTSPYGCIWDTVTEISICLSPKKYGIHITSTITLMAPSFLIQTLSSGTFIPVTQ